MILIARFIRIAAICGNLIALALLYVLCYKVADFWSRQLNRLESSTHDLL
jgi:hypothetical protein